jgi:hypothetical protein
MDRSSLRVLRLLLEKPTRTSKRECSSSGGRALDGWDRHGRLGGGERALRGLVVGMRLRGKVRVEPDRRIRIGRIGS